MLLLPPACPKSVLRSRQGCNNVNLREQGQIRFPESALPNRFECRCKARANTVPYKEVGYIS